MTPFSFVLLAAASLVEGRIALEAKRYAEARGIFEQVLAADPSNSAAHLNLGIIALVENDALAGLRHFSAVPGDLRALIGRLDCELRLDRKADARATAQSLAAMADLPAPAAAHAGTLLAAAAEYAAAVPLFSRVPGARGLHLLASAEEKRGNLPAAVRGFAEAARLQPANEDFRLDHAAVLVQAGQLEAAVTAFRAAVEAFPRSGRAHLGLGSTLYVAGHHQDAARVLLSLVGFEPTPRAYDLLGKAFDAAGPLRSEIESAFRQYVATHPSDAGSFAHYGAMLFARGDSAQARSVLGRALQIDSDLAAAHFQLGVIEQTADNPSIAMGHYERAVALEPSAAVYYRMAGVYQKLGKVEKARSALARFRELKAGLP